MPLKFNITITIFCFTESQHQVESLTKNLQRTQSEKASLRFDNEGLRNSNAELQKDNNALRSDGEELRRDMEDLKKRVAKMEQDLKTKDAEVRVLVM